MLPSLRRGAFARARTAAVVAVAALAAVLPAGVAHADALPNDDFDGSAVVTALPFTAHQDTSRATKAPDDPSWCQYYDAEGSVWFSYTPTEDVILRATTAGSDHPTILSAYSGLRGSLRGASRACDTGQPSTGASVTFRATAGTTYHLMVAGYDVAGGDLSFGLTTVAAAPNDRFADAEAVTGLPATRTPDLSTAWYEQDEPDSGCTDQAGPSVWYSFTPTTTTSAVVGLDHSNVTATVYTGDTIAGLTQVACTTSRWDPLVFLATAGTTYRIRVAGWPDLSDTVGVSLTEAPRLDPYVDVWPSDPTIYEEVGFTADMWDPFREPVVSGEWDFGDGTTAPVREQGPTYHHFAADGVYQVGVTVVTRDGRVGTTTRAVTVESHDVAITKFTVPSSAKAGQSKPVTVRLANTRYRESATVDLYVDNGQSRTLVGTTTLDVPARETGKVDVPFSYTFTAADALMGKVAFRAVVRLPYPVRDARPADNEVIALATTVKPGTTAMKSA